MDHLVIHCDWALRPRGRWVATAEIRADRVTADTPEPVGDLTGFWARVLDRAGPDSAVTVGFDFPIGVPAAWAEIVGLDDFPALLPQLGWGRWGRFYDPAEHAGEIEPTRPFYPMRPGGTRQQHLVDGLGISGRDALLRRCERATSARGPACPLFWTLGGNQVGKAAIAGWRSVIVPALKSPLDVRIWPFAGDLSDVQAPGTITLAETYPADAAVQLGLDPPGRGWSKRNRIGRRHIGRGLRSWSERRGVQLSPPLSAALADGFGDGRAGEDPLDAALGLFGMLEVVLGHRSDGVPDDDIVRSIEGWILGMEESRADSLGSGSAEHPM